MSWIIHRIRIVRRWHARIGMTAMLYLLFLVFSGWALNHANALKLDELEITSPWLMRWYGIHEVIPDTGFILGDSHLAWSGEKWLLGDRLLSKKLEQPLGAVENAGIVFIATPYTLSIFQHDGQLLDKLETSSLPAVPIIALGKAGDKIALKTHAAVFFTVDGLSWEKGGATSVTWSTTQVLPEEVKRRLSEKLAPGLPLQRILLDIHSGRIFGQYGPLFVDMVGLALLTLGLSGLWIYWRSVRQGRIRKQG